MQPNQIRQAYAPNRQTSCIRPQVSFQQYTGKYLPPNVSVRKGGGKYNLRDIFKQWVQAHRKVNRTRLMFLTVDPYFRNTANGKQHMIDSRLQWYERELQRLHRPICIALRQELARRYPHAGFTQKGQEKLISGFGVFEHASSNLHAHILLFTHPYITPSMVRSALKKALGKVQGNPNKWGAHCRLVDDLEKVLDYITKEIRLMPEYWNSDEVRWFPV